MPSVSWSVGHGSLGRYGLVVVAASMWAALAVWTVELADRGVDPVDIGFWRAAVGGACFVVHVGLRRRAWPVGVVGSPVPLLGFALVAVTMFYVALPAAVDAGGIGLAWLLLFTAPVWVTLGAVRFLREPLTPSSVAVVFLAATGVALVVFGSGADGIRVTPASVAWGLAAGIGYASYTVFGKRLSAHTPPVVLYAVVLPLGALPLLPAVDLTPGAETFWWIVALGVFSTYLPYLAYSWAITRLGASRAAVVATVELPIALVFAAVVYDEQLGWVAVGGAALIIAAAVGSVAPWPSDREWLRARVSS